MSDHAQIASLLSRLAWAVDHQEFDSFLDYWVEDATLVCIGVDGTRFQCDGAAKILELVNTPIHPSAHIVTNAIIDVDGDSARARYYTIHTPPGPNARPVGVGEYDTRLKRGSDGRWRMAVMTEAQLLDFEKV